MEQLLLSKKDAAKALGVCVRTVENFIAAKQLIARRVGRRTLVPATEIRKFALRDHASPAREARK